MVMGMGDEDCWTYSGTYNGLFDYKTRELMREYVKAGVPVNNPAEIYKGGSFWGDQHQDSLQQLLGIKQGSDEGLPGHCPHLQGLGPHLLKQKKASRWQSRKRKSLSNP